MFGEQISVTAISISIIHLAAGFNRFCRIISRAAGTVILYHGVRITFHTDRLQFHKRLNEDEQTNYNFQRCSHALI